MSDADAGRAGLGRRAIRIGSVALRHAGRAVGGAVFSRGEEGTVSARLAVAAPTMLTELGPFYVKVGQLLSTRRDLLPERWCGELGRLTDTVPAPSRAELEAVLTEEFGPVGQWPFQSFEWEPVGSGSIATVHRAVLADGSVVAVKIRRPGIVPVISGDFRLAAAMARLAGKLPGMRRLPAEEMLGQVGAAVLAQADLAAERASLTQLRANLAGVKGVRLPAPVEGLGSEQVLVMEFLDDLRDFRPEPYSPQERRDAMQRVLRTVYQMLFLDGLVHCDLHPGNLRLDGSGDVVLLDAGFVVRLPEQVRRHFGEFFLSMALGRGRRCAEIVIESAARVPEDCDLEAFRTAVEQLVGDASAVVAADFNLAAFAPKLFKLQRRFGIFAAAEFAFPLLSLLVLEGMIHSFDPGVDFQGEAVPVLMQAVGMPEEQPEG
ncbi:ABC1 kinase family protein [Kitasatospora sp. NPDC057015]|uniref:ABC1 kinase family protein n=1 Tax=Kitasatospora sp. NPDC057015 TaxID=3346001 RepID=UPI003638309B